MITMVIKIETRRTLRRSVGCRHGRATAENVSKLMSGQAPWLWKRNAFSLSFCDRQSYGSETSWMQCIMVWATRICTKIRCGASKRNLGSVTG